jgi:hypothetical protein
MNGIAKRKKQMNGFSKHGINECCCPGVKVQLCCNGYVYMVSQNRTAIVKPQEQEPTILEGTIQNCCGNYAFFSTTLNNRSDELFLYRGEQCSIPVLEKFKNNIYYYEKPSRIISAANDSIVLSGLSDLGPIITLYQGEKRNEYAPSNMEWRLINRINCNTDYISYVQNAGSSSYFIQTPLIYKGDMISSEAGQAYNDLNFACAEFLWLKTSKVLYGSGTILGNINDGYVTLLGYAVLGKSIYNTNYKLYYNNTSTLLYEGNIKSTYIAGARYNTLYSDWIAISPDDNNIKLFHKAELVYDGQKNGLDFDITKTYLFGDSYRAEINDDNSNHLTIYYENQKIVESHFYPSIQESEGLLYVQSESNRFNVFINGNLLYDSQYRLNKCGNRFTQQLNNITIIIDPVFGLMTFDNQTFIRTDSLV